MALTPTIRGSQAGVMLVTTFETSGLSVGMVGALVVANFPTPEMDVSQAGAVVVTNHESVRMQVSQAGVLVVARGRVYNPKLRAWPYTLDAHDKYVLRLAEGKTLVYDLSTEQWSWYSSGELDFWRPNIGMNWYAPGTVPQLYGSNIICGDDTFGHLWVLAPEQGYDDYAASPPGDPQRFPRRATGQVITRQRIFLPVYEVYLTASVGEPVLTGDTVTLEYSDDLGNTYVNAGALQVTEGDFKQQFAWRSLGQISQAGRLLRIADDGAFARIDGLDCSIGGLDG
jgi:hypothetical protein